MILLCKKTTKGTKQRKGGRNKWMLHVHKAHTRSSHKERGVNADSLFAWLDFAYFCLFKVSLDFVLRLRFSHPHIRITRQSCMHVSLLGTQYSVPRKKCKQRRKKNCVWRSEDKNDMQPSVKKSSLWRASYYIIMQSCTILLAWTVKKGSCHYRFCCMQQPQLVLHPYSAPVLLT